MSHAPRTGVVRRHPLHKLVLQQAVYAAVLNASICKPAGCHTGTLHAMLSQLGLTLADL